MAQKQVDYKLFFTVFSLIIFGMIMISSVSVYSSYKITSIMAKAGKISDAYNYFYVFRSIIHVAISLVLLLLFVKVPYKYYEKHAKQLFVGSIVLLISVLVIGATWNGARGWIDLPFLPFAIQPTEFLKITLIIYLAYFFKMNHKNITSFENSFIPFLSIIGFVVLLIALQPDFGTILLLVPLSVLIFFRAGANVKYLGILFLMGIIFATSVYTIGDYDKVSGKNINSLGYIKQRIDNFLNDSEDAIKNKTINYQTEQALIAIGSGGFSGLGFGASIQKFGYLPEVQGDFIFSVIVEELGFLGALIILGMYMFIGYRGVYIAFHSTDLFARYVAIGITSRFLLQAFINIGVNLNILPLTGVTLPFISYGGSSLISSVIGLAILLNISRDIDLTKNSRGIIFRGLFNKSRVKNIFR
ncbi:MAG: putative peptidoglycan glycosyltransferase FtsW [Candidatus Gracilibacteria bacterium]|nr:putative peptidoglycan glycosyltransferase FtsW [Candidatus Gracilibacteria bacterium]